MTDQFVTDSTQQFYIWSVADNIQKARHYFDFVYSKRATSRQQLLTIERMIDGAPPHDQGELDAAGLGYMTNKNFGEARFHVRSVEYTFWSLANEVKNIAKFTIDLPPPGTLNVPMGTPQPNYLIYEEMLGDVWTKSLKLWSQFSLRRNLIGSYLSKFGTALAVWDKPSTWRFEVPHPVNIVLPVDAKTDVETWYFLGVINTYTPEELWRLVVNGESSKAAGWDIDSLKQLLLVASAYWLSTDKGTAGTIDYDSQWAQLESVVSNDPRGVATQYSSDFRLVNMWYKQKNDKVGQVIFSRAFSTSDFLFKKEDVYEEFKQFTQLFTFQPGVEYYDSAIGVGGDIFELVDAITLADCRVLDQVHRASTLFVSNSGATNQETRAYDLTLGAINDLGSGSLQQSNIFNAIAPTISGANYLRQNLQNAGILGGFNVNVPDSVKRGREEMAQKATKEYKVYKNYTAHHYEQLDMFLPQLFNRFMGTESALAGGEEKKYFLKKLERQQFPVRLLEGKKNFFGMPEALELSASRILGSGSNTADQMLANDLLSMSGMLGPAGRKNLTRYVFAIKTGYEHEAAFFPEEDNAQRPNNEDSIVALENNMIRMGYPVEFGENQDHLRHASGHAQVGIDLQNEIESQQLDPAKYNAEPDEEPVIIANAVLQQLIPHWVKHLVALDQDPLLRGEAKQLKIVYGTLVNFSRKIQAAALSATQAKQKKAEKLSQQEIDLARQQNVDTQEIQMKYQKVFKELDLQALKISKQADLETLMGLIKAKDEQENGRLKIVMEHRERLLSGAKDSGSGE